MWIPKCKYLRASRERVLENVLGLGSTCSVSNGGMWACNWSCCPFLYVNVCEVTGPIATYIFDYCVVKLLIPWKLLKLD